MARAQAATRRKWILMGVVGVAAIAAALVLARLAFGPPAAESGGDGPAAPLKITVTIPPLRELAHRLAPAGSDIKVLMLPGQSEHGYEFTPVDIAALAGSDVVVYVGLGLEPQVEKFLADNRSRRRQDVCMAIAAGVSPEAEGEHDHGDDESGHEHSHAVDPHLWLDPALVRKLVPVLSGAIGAALKSGGGDSAEAITALVKAEEDLMRDIDAVDAEYRRALASHRDAVMVTHHSAWGRLAERYGLKIAAVIRPVESAEPTPGQITKAVEAVRHGNSRAIFVEPQFDPAGARRIAESAGVKVLVLDPLGSGDWISLMQANLKVLSEGL